MSGALVDVEVLVETVAIAKVDIGGVIWETLEPRRVVHLASSPLRSVVGLVEVVVRLLRRVLAIHQTTDCVHT